METNSAFEKVTKKKGKTKFHSKTVCTQSKWANEQTLKTELLPFYLSVHAFFYYNKCLFVSLFLKVSVYECCYGVCSFAHLLCVHTVFERNFIIPFFLLPSRLQ